MKKMTKAEIREFNGAPAKPCVCKYFDIDLESS